MMTTSVSPNELSLCQSRRAEWPSTLRRTSTTSWSQLEPGNWRTAKLIFAPYRIRSGIYEPEFSALLQFKSIILDHRIAEDFMAGLVNLFASGFLISSCEVHLEVFADVHCAYTLVTHMR